MAGKEGYFHNCNGRKIDPIQGAPSLMGSGLTDAQCNIIWDFYVIHYINNQTESFKNYGWETTSKIETGYPALEEQLAHVAGIESFCLIKNNTIKDTLNAMNLTGSQICIEHPRAVSKILAGDYWTGKTSSDYDVLEVSDNNSGSDYSYVFTAKTRSGSSIMTEKHGVRPVIQVDLTRFSMKDLDEYWPESSFSEQIEGGNTEIDFQENYAILDIGSKGDAVQTLQQALIEQGYLSGTADGDFGNKTAEAVKQAQAAFGMEQTGVADDAFQKKLYGE